MSALQIISLGAGVQSSTMALMAAHGELTPMPDCAIFADTQAEPDSVYRWLEWLEKRLPFPVHRVSAGDLGEKVLRVRTSKNGNKYTQSAIPAFIADTSGNPGGPQMRQCTGDFKIVPIQRKVRELIGKRGEAIQWIGISLDEASRMKPSQKKYINNRWPLIFDRPMTRAACLSWMARQKYPTPPRSSCIFCPYHSNAEWRHLRDTEPKAFSVAIEWERQYQNAMSQCINGTPYLHRSCKPLSEVDLEVPLDNSGQLNLFQNECEGMCGV